MEAKYRRALRELDRQIKEAQAAENFEDEVEARGRKVTLLTVAQAWANAATELDLMAQLVADQEQTHNLAQARFAQARALSHLPDRYDEAEKRFTQALALYDEAGDEETPITLLQALAGLHLARGDEAAMAQVLNDAFARLPPTVSDPVPPINFYRYRAGCHALLLNFQAALADLEQALALAQQVGDDELLRVVFDQHEAATHLAQGRWSPELGIMVWPDLPGLPTPTLLADEDLIKALELVQNGRFRPAFRFAQKVLDNARQAHDLYRYIRYLLASIILAQLHDERDERVEVLTVLLRCKVYLEMGLGMAVRPYIDQFLDAITERWGENGRQAAIRAYQKQVAQQGPIPL